MSLKERTFTAVRWTTVTTGLRALLHLAQIAALTRMLTPSDYGLLAVVSATLAFAGHFTDFGLNSALIQRRTITDDQRSSLYWTNVSLGAAVTALIVCSAPALAWWMNDERLIPLVSLSALVILIQASAAQLKTQAEKNLDFRPIALIEVGSMVAAVAASIYLAYLGNGAASIVFGTLLGALLGSALSWGLLRQGWCPRLRLKVADVRPFLRFGGILMANNVVNQINAVADIFVGNRLLGATQMGLFVVPRNLALQIQDAVNPIVTRVGFPLISQVQLERAQVARVYLQTLRVTASVNAPTYLFVAGFAPEVIFLLLGEAWHALGDTLRLLALWGALRSTASPVGSLLFGVGRADLALRWNLALFVLTPASMWLASGYGINGLALALLFLQVGLFMPGWYFLVRPTCGATFVAYADAAVRPMLLAAVACVAAVLVCSPVEGAWARCVAGATALAGTYIGLSICWNREWLRAMLELVRLHQLAGLLGRLGDPLERSTGEAGRK